MAKIESRTEWVNNGLLFMVDGKHYLFDTGACCGVEIVARDSFVGGFSAATGGIAKFALEMVAPAFAGLRDVSGIFAGIRTLTYFLEKENILIADAADADAIEDCVKGRKELYFLPFQDRGIMFPATFVDATVNGYDTQLLFDTGARMTILHDDEFLINLPQTGTVNDFVAMAGHNMQLPVFQGEMRFPCGLRRICNLSFVRDEQIDVLVTATGGMVTGVLGIDLLDEYDLLIRKDGLHLYERVAK